MENFTINRSTINAISKIKDPLIRLEIYESLMRYSLDGIEPTSENEHASFVLEIVKPIIEKRIQLHKNGSKGGRPKNQTETKIEPSENQTEIKQKPKINQTETNLKPNQNQNKPNENQIKPSQNQTETKSFESVNNKESNSYVSNDGFVDSDETTISDKYISNIDIYNNNNNNIYTDNIIEDNIIKKEKENIKEKEKEILPKSENVPYEEIKNLFNETCKSLPRIRDMSSTRKNKVRLRWNEVGKDIGVIKEIFERVQKSQYCTGNNYHGWRATFDWIFDNDRNINKILEGNYDNRINNNRRTTTEIPISQKIFNDTTIYDD